MHCYKRKKIPAFNPLHINELRTLGRYFYFCEIFFGMKTLLPLLLCAWPLLLYAQDGVLLPISLNEVVELSQSETPSADIARKTAELAEWKQKAFKAGFKPSLKLDASAPQLFRGITALHLPDGREAFLQRTLANYQGGLTLEQPIAATGGRLFLSSRLERLDLFQPFASNYLAIPVTLGFQQTVFGFNPLHWARQIEPLKQKELLRRSSEQLAEAAWRSASLFLDLFEAQTLMETANLAKIETDSLTLLANQRREAGKMALDEEMQIQLLAQQAESDLALYSLNLRQANARLQDFLGIVTPMRFQPVPPTFLPDIAIDVDLAMAKAIAAGSLPIALERRALEAKMQLAQAQAARNPQIQVFAEIGLVQTAPGIPESYQNLQNHQRAAFGISFPIVDWGETRAGYEMARLEEEIETIKISRDQRLFEREVQLMAIQLDTYRKRAILTQDSWQMARQGREISRNRYALGKIPLSNLQLALLQEKEALRENLQALREYWLTFYMLRKLTLYDFEAGLPLTSPETSR